MQQAHAHRARGRLVAGEQHQDAELAELEVGQAVALHLGLEQRPEEVVAGLPPAVRDQPVDVGLRVAHRPGLVVLVEQGAREHPLHPVEPALLVLLREVHEARERAERHGVGELGHDVAAAVARDRLEQPRREGFEVGAHGVDARLGEPRVDERAIPGVLRWGELDRKEWMVSRL